LEENLQKVSNVGVKGEHPTGRSRTRWKKQVNKNAIEKEDRTLL